MELDFVTAAALLLTGAAAGALLRRNPKADSSAPTPQADTSTFGSYTRHNVIGEGGMGTVYRASHARLQRPTAIKVMRLTESDPQQRQRALARFEREARLTSQLSHPNTVVIYDYGQTDDGNFYYAMELIEGVDLQRLVAVEGPLPFGRAIHFMLQACASLTEAHAHDMIHRDLKPANLLVCERGGEHDNLKVVDFGLAKDLHAPSISTANVVVGTPAYVAPEVIVDPKRASIASDVYSLGAVLYWLVTGATVTNPEGGAAALATLLTDGAPSPAAIRSDLPVDLERVIMRCLSRNPFDRPSTTTELATELRACRDFGTWTHADATAYWAGPGQRWLGAANTVAT